MEIHSHFHGLSNETIGRVLSCHIQPRELDETRCTRDAVRLIDSLLFAGRTRLGIPNALLLTWRLRLFGMFERMWLP